MNKLFLLALLSLATTTAFATPGCGLGEVRAFSKSVNPDDEMWVKADGRNLPIVDNQALFSLIGGVYGGDQMTNFNLPKVDDLELNGKKYPYYVCTQGEYPAGRVGAVSYIIQYPNSSSYDIVEDFGFVNMGASVMLPYSEHAAYAALMPYEFFDQDKNILVPQAVLSEVVKNGPAKLRNYMSVDGDFVIDDLFDCEQGGIYFTLSTRAVEAGSNYKEIISDRAVGEIFKDGVKLDARVRVMQCGF
jgi:hypothetical protein